MLQALNTGHDGSLSTIHANGVDDALRRLETLVLLAGSGLPLDAVRAQASSSLDAVVFVARHPGGARRIEAIAEVVVGATGLRARPGFARHGAALVGVGMPARSPRRPDAPSLQRGLVRVLTFAVALAGVPTATLLAVAARRAARGHILRPGFGRLGNRKA